jgi:hypothetical protein
MVRTDQKYLNYIKRLEMNMYREICKERKQKDKIKKNKTYEETKQVIEEENQVHQDLHASNKEIINNFDLNVLNLKDAYEVEAKKNQRLSDDTFLCRKSARNKSKTVDYNLQKLENKAYGHEFIELRYNYRTKKSNDFLRSAGVSPEDFIFYDTGGI